MSKLPATILIIRHGEKTADRTNPHLSAAGQARARMLAKRLPALYPNICALFATARSKDSDRPCETIKPLAKKLGLKIDDSFAAGQYPQLVAHILRNIGAYHGKTVLICWHHEKIPAMTRRDFGQAFAPTTWADDAFDQIWRIDWQSRAKSIFYLGRQPSVRAKRTKRTG